jgi:glucose-1-phosphate cytidylyltransferase
MKIVILAGGMGTRLSELTEVIPKPMVNVGGYPILWHILKIYNTYGFNDFIIALGYKSSYIKNFFKNHKQTIEIVSKNKIETDIIIKNKSDKNIKIKLVETGKFTMTGGRLLRLEKFLKNHTFMLTYGDGVSNVNIKKLLRFHQLNKKIITVTAVHPIARFGELQLKKNLVVSFKEKPQTQKTWINGGFFVMEPSIFRYIKNDKTILEKEPLEIVSKINQFIAFRHSGFWQCMDTLRDKKLLDNLWREKKALWKVW